MKKRNFTMRFIAAEAYDETLSPFDVYAVDDDDVDDIDVPAYIEAELNRE